MPSLESRDYTIDAVATIAGRDYTQGYDVIEHRDLETRYLYHPATTSVRGVDVTIAPGLKVGYVMGIGDDVPAGIAQLGAAVTLLGEQDLASGDLRQYDAIMTGTRAYAVRDDLKTYNRRLLDYVQQGGNLIVLYNTQEFVPNLYAPFPAQLPRNGRGSLGRGFAGRDPGAVANRCSRRRTGSRRPTSTAGSSSAARSSSPSGTRPTRR